MTELQEQVKERARLLLQDEPWFRGVCLDNFPTDEDIRRDGVDEHAQQVALETAMWDDPTFLRGNAKTP